MAMQINLRFASGKVYFQPDGAATEKRKEWYVC
jgi:hypothetical protein